MRRARASSVRREPEACALEGVSFADICVCTRLADDLAGGHELDGAEEDETVPCDERGVAGGCGCDDDDACDCGFEEVA